MKRTLLTILFATAALTAVAADQKLAWQETEDAYALLNHGKTVWRFNKGDEGSKPYFHPVSLSNGTVLTEPRPADHPWHLALWFSWKYLNGRNYWEENPETHVSDGVTKLVSSSFKKNPDFSAVVELQLAYHPKDEKPILTENRRIEIDAPRDDGGYGIDWTSVFKTLDKKVLFDRTPILGEKNGVEYGGYAGLSIRFTNQAKHILVSSPQGLITMNIGKHRYSESHPWMDYTFKLKDGTEAGIAIIDHKSNLRHPTPWYSIVNPETPFYYYSPAILHEAPFSLDADQSFTLRYRIVIHPGRTDMEAMNREMIDFHNK